MSSVWTKGLSAIASVGVIGALLSGCGASSNTAGANASSASGKPVEGGSITVDTSQAVPDLDPAVAYDTTSSEVISQLYDTLVTYNKSTYEIVGNLAKSYEISTDGLTYTFHLQPNVKFWNGDPMTSKDFVFQLERILNKNMKPKPSSVSSFFLNIQGANAYFNGQAKSISGVSTPNDQTLVIKLVKPQAFFIQVLAEPFLVAVDPSFVNKVGNAAFDTTQAMGTGPFKLESISQGQTVLVKNQNYWKKDSHGQQLPYLDKITFNVNNDSQIDAMHWEQGQTAFMSPWTMGGDGIPSSQYPTIMHSPKYSQNVQKQPENTIAYIGLNSSKTIDGKPNPLSNVNVRKAIEYGFNDAQMVQLKNNAVLPLNQPLPSGLQGYVKKLDSDATYGLNIAKAKQLLQQAGYANGLTLTLWDQNTPDARKQDQAFQAMMQQIGIKVNLQEVTWNDFLSKEESGTAQMFFGGWEQDFPDPSDFLNTLLNSSQSPVNNCAMYNNPQVDQWLNEAQYMTDQAHRNELYAKVVNQAMADAIWVPVYQQVGYYSIQSWVHGFYTSPVMADPLAYIWIDQSHSSN